MPDLPARAPGPSALLSHFREEDSTVLSPARPSGSRKAAPGLVL